MREADTARERAAFDPLPKSSHTSEGLFAKGPSGQLYVRPNARFEMTGGIEEDIVVRTNALGLRGGESAPRARDETRILFLGDSIVFGDYVREENTLPAKLAAALSKHGPATVFNGGVPGASLADEVHRYFELRHTLDHDVVLLGLYLNDAQDSRRTRILRSRPAIPWSRFLSFASETMGLLEARRELVALGADEHAATVLAEIGWRGAANRPERMECRTKEDVDAWVAWAADDFGQAFTPSAWSRMEVSLRLLHEAVSEDGRRLAIVLFPVQFQVISPYLDRRPQQAFAEVCGRLGSPCLDPLPALREEWPRHKDPLLFDHCHYSVTGHDVLAPRLAAWLAEAGVLK